MQSTQNFTSANTSINSTKAPAIYKMKKAVELMSNKKVIDIGGGKFDIAISTAKHYNATVAIYDPYNRTPTHNASVINDNYDVAIISNVLNVIDSAAARADVLKLAATKADTVLITVYEGNRSGKGKVTGTDTYQENRVTADYLDEIVQALPDYNVARFSKLITATKN